MAEELQFDREVLAVDGEAVLAPDEREAATVLEQEPLHPADEGVLEVTLREPSSEVE